MGVSENGIPQRMDQLVDFQGNTISTYKLDMGQNYEWP
jgi:hypothetical protein